MGFRIYNYREFMKNINGQGTKKNIVTKGEASYYLKNNKTFKTTAPIIKRGQERYDYFDLKKVDGQYSFYVGAPKETLNFFVSKQGKRSRETEIMALLIYNYLLEKKDEKEHTFSQWIELIQLVSPNTLRYVDKSLGEERLIMYYSEEIRYMYKNIFTSAIAILNINCDKYYFMKNRNVHTYQNELKYLNKILGEDPNIYEERGSEISDELLTDLYKNLIEWDYSGEGSSKEEMIKKILWHREFLTMKISECELEERSNTKLIFREDSSLEKKKYSREITFIETEKINTMNERLQQYSEKNNITSRKEKKKIRERYVKQVFDSDYYMLQYAFNINQLKYGRNKYKFMYNNVEIEIGYDKPIPDKIKNDMIIEFKNIMFKKRVTYLVDRELYILNKLFFISDDLQDENINNFFDNVVFLSSLGKLKEFKYKHIYCIESIKLDLEYNLYEPDMDFIKDYYYSKGNEIRDSYIRKNGDLLELADSDAFEKYKQESKAWLDEGLLLINDMLNC